MFKRTCLCGIVFVIVLVCALARTVPPKNLYIRDVSGNDTVKTLTVRDIITYHDCKVGASGRIEMTGSDPHIILNVNRSFSSMVIRTDTVSETYPVQVFFNSGSGFSEGESIYLFNRKDENRVAFDWKGTNVRQIRLDINVSYNLNAIELHSGPTVLTEYTVKIGAGYYLLDLFISFLAAAIVFILDLKCRIFRKAAVIFARNKKQLLIHTAGLLGCALLGLAIGLILHLIAPAANAYYSLFRFVFITGSLFTLFCVAVGIKTADRHIETVFLRICLTLGAVMIIITPFGHNAWDIDIHYKWALNASYWGGNAVITEADNSILSGEAIAAAKHSATKTTAAVERMNQQYSVFFNQEKGTATLAHYPTGLFLALARLFGGSFYSVVTFGKLGNLLVYALVCYFAIRKLKSGKMILTVLALFPTNLVLATSYSYDYWVTSFGFLGMAYFVGALQRRDKPVSVRDTVIMCGAFALAAVPKLVYALLLIIPFFMKRKKIQNPKVYYSICFLAIVTLFGMLALKTFSTATGSGDLRGGGDVNSLEQVHFIFSQPVGYAKILLRFLWGYLSIGGMRGYITHYAYYGIGAGSTVFIILMAFTALTDKNPCDKRAYGGWTRALCTLQFPAIAAAVASALYVSFTAVGADTVAGCQPRYLIPLLYPLLSVICGGGLPLKINRKIYNCAVLLPALAVNLWNIRALLLSQWR